MALKALHFKYALVLFTAASLSLAGCGGNGGDEDGDDQDTTKTDTVKTNFFKVDNALFSVPSPIQTSLLIKKSGANYSKEMLNQVKNKSGYSTNFKKGLNLGVYGADLGYVTIYEQTQDAIGYLNAVQQLANELGVSGAFDQTLLKRFESNLGNKDSLLSLVSVAYRASDSYLKNNDRKDVSALVLAGGWVESLYFSINIAKNTKSQDVINRIGEQKNSLDNLIKLLQPYYDKPEYTEFIDALVDLAYDFDAVQSKYTYVKPTVDVKNKITTIHSKTDIVISDDQVKSISEKVENIRKQIVG
jgi:hypothetical protein